MDGNNKEEKAEEFGELLQQYTEMGETLHKMSLELGYCSGENDKLYKEFQAMLEPLGFFVWQADRLHYPNGREVYQVRLCKKLPIEIENGDKYAAAVGV